MLRWVSQYRSKPAVMRGLFKVSSALRAFVRVYHSETNVAFFAMHICRNRVRFFVRNHFRSADRTIRFTNSNIDCAAAFWTYKSVIVCEIHVYPILVPVILPTPTAVTIVPGWMIADFFISNPVTFPTPIAWCSPLTITIEFSRDLFKFPLTQFSCLFFQSKSIGVEKSMPLFLSIMSAQFEQRKIAFEISLLRSTVNVLSYLGPPSAAAVIWAALPM